MIPEESKCLNGWLHRFNLSEQGEFGVFEVCDRCRQRVFFRVSNGRINNENYLKYHARQALPPNHPLFYREYFYEREELKEFIYE